MKRNIKIFKKIGNKKYTTIQKKKDIVLGVTQNEISELGKTLTKDKYQNFIKSKEWKNGKVRIIYDIDENHDRIAFVGIEKEKNKSPGQYPTDTSEIEDTRESVFQAVKELIKDDKETDQILIDNFENTKEASEGAHLGVFSFDKYVINKNKKIKIITETKNKEEWEKGEIYATSEIFSKILSETPANLMTPTIFCNDVINKIKNNENISIYERDKSWIEKMEMNSFLSVSKGSIEAPKLLEVHYTPKKVFFKLKKRMKR
jgi:cytosol aminopeptidase